MNAVGGAAARDDELLELLTRAALWQAADTIRRAFHLAARARVLATQAGPEHVASWPVLTDAARLETGAHELAARLDEFGR